MVINKKFFLNKLKLRLLKKLKKIFFTERIVSFTHTPVNYVPLEFRRAMLAIIVDRIRDEAATVRTRALMILSELISAKSSPTVLHLMQDIFVKPYLNMSSICNITNSNENDFLKWKTFVASLDKVSW